MRSIDLPDVQSSPSQSNFKLTRVGVTDVKKLVNIKRPGRNKAIPLVIKMDLFVDLPASQKGSHIKLKNDETGSVAIIPDHKELDRWTLKIILRETELSEEEIKKYL